jgi:23S rRNA G2445 N2-methylase RlmL
MCGSGTLLIEAAMIAMDLPARFSEKDSVSRTGKIMMLICFRKLKNSESTE